MGLHSCPVSAPVDLPGVAFRRMRGKWVAREVSPQEWGMGVDQKDPILRTGRKNLGVQKGRAQGERDT